MLSEFQVPIHVASWGYPRDLLHCHSAWPCWEAESHSVGEPSDFYIRLALCSIRRTESKEGSATQAIIEAEVFGKRLAATVGDRGERHDPEPEDPDDENPGGQHAHGDDR